MIPVRVNVTNPDKPFTLDATEGWQAIEPNGKLAKVVRLRVRDSVELSLSIESARLLRDTLTLLVGAA